MCLAALAVNCLAEWPLIAIANRDEFHNRPSQPLHTWTDVSPTIAAGRDLQSGGTWMGIGANGRFALLTNVRSAALQRGDRAPSRGALVVNALHGQMPSMAEAPLYSGFNLIAGQLVAPHGTGVEVELDYTTNQLDHGPQPTRLSAGVHALSNGALDCTWPKTSRLSQAMFSQFEKWQKLRNTSSPSLDIKTLEAWAFDALACTQQAPDEHLPNTGVPLEWERMLSAIKIVSPVYGTRSSAVVAVHADGQAYFTEWTYLPDGNVAGVARLQLKLI